MKTFLCWSGKKSKETAETFAEWLPQVIQAIEPWISTEMDKGTRWTSEVADKLGECRIGIICLTRENMNARWILFEAGALSRDKNTHVCTFLLDVKSTDIEQPLAQFQHTQFDKNDVRKLVQTINRKLKDVGEQSLKEKVLNRVFEKNWPELSDKLSEIKRSYSVLNEDTKTDREILEEMLENMKTLRETLMQEIQSEKYIGIAESLYHEIKQQIYPIQQSIAITQIKIGKELKKGENIGILKDIEKIVGKIDKDLIAIQDKLEKMRRSADMGGIGTEVHRNITEILMEVIKDFSIEYAHMYIELDRSRVKESLPLISINITYLDYLRYIFRNILINSKDAFKRSKIPKEKRRIIIETLENGKKIYIRFFDNALGLKPEIKQKLFREPVSMYKEKTRGRFLYTATFIINAMGGSIRYLEDDELLGGMKAGFEISLNMKEGKK